MAFGKFAGLDVLKPGRTAGAAARRGRPFGKRSNPEWAASTFFLKRESSKKVQRLLREREDGMDFSELIQSLLEKWLTEQK